jgi:hypothetical protein
MPLPSWDENLPSTSRFTLLPAFNNEAVRDNNTGLVWERAPGGPAANGWAQAAFFSLTKIVGGTMGWRLPSIVELRSVMDPALPAPYVPTSVFGPSVGSIFWSATTVADDPSRAWFLDFIMGAMANDVKTSNIQSYWCVRGPMNADKY